MASILSSALGKTTEAAHSAFATLAAASQVTVGGNVPAVDVKEKTPDSKLNLATLPGKNVIVTVPAAFSPSCSETHVPGYISKYDEIIAKGVSGIYILSVNDTFCMNAWKKTFGEGAEKLHFVADDKGDFSSGTGLIFDASAFLGGPRAKRAALVIENGKVLHVAVEKEPPQVDVSSAESTLKAL